MAEETQVQVVKLRPGPTTATWKIENETFRRIARTGEFEPKKQETAA